jgi:hypothetical protein
MTLPTFSNAVEPQAVKIKGFYSDNLVGMVVSRVQHPLMSLHALNDRYPIPSLKPSESSLRQ